MICFDNMPLSDYLAGEKFAREFLDPYADEVWCLSSVVVFEAMMGALHDRIPGGLDEVERVISEFETADVSARTAREAADLQAEFSNEGV